MNEQLPSDPSDITQRAYKLRDEFDTWLRSRNYSPLSPSDKATVSAFAAWLMNGHTLKAKSHE